jgi:hypothetical protein
VEFWERCDSLAEIDSFVGGGVCFHDGERVSDFRGGGKLFLVIIKSHFVDHGESVF